MRDLRDFSVEEWSRLDPLVQFCRQTYSQFVQSIFLRRRPKSLGRFLQDNKHLNGQNIGIIVAFEQPWALDWLLKMAARNLSDVTLLVFDNSKNKQARTDIERVCRHHGIPYLALPSNQTRHANRSHGLAMSWIFYNVIQVIRPGIFGFIDHDLIPMEKIDIKKILGDQPFYGKLKVNKWGWQLWAGYCWYNFSIVQCLPLNFLHDFSRGLDTGGQNWSCLYKNYDFARLRFGGTRQINITDPLQGTPHCVSVLDDKWIHIGGASYRKSFKDEFQFFKLIAQAADKGKGLHQLISISESDKCNKEFCS